MVGTKGFNLLIVLIVNWCLESVKLKAKVLCVSVPLATPFTKLVDSISTTTKAAAAGAAAAAAAAPAA